VAVGVVDSGDEEARALGGMVEVADIEEEKACWLAWGSTAWAAKDACSSSSSSWGERPPWALFLPGKGMGN